MTKWVEPDSAALKALPDNAVACRADGKHAFGRLADHVSQNRYITSLTLTSMVLRIPCGLEVPGAGCGCFLDVEYDMRSGRRGRVIRSAIDYKPTRDESGTSTYLMPPNSGRLHADEARGELFARLHVEARTGPSQPGAKKTRTSVRGGNVVPINTAKRRAS